MSAVRTASDNARDPIEAIRALDARLPLAMQRADDDLLAAVRSDLARRWHGDGAGEGDDAR
ncbi:MAG: hypothetical protein ACOY82_04530 [Pseudomonadota bacterium]